MRPFDSVILTEDLSDTLLAGTEGAIVDVYAHVDDVFIVELFDRDGKTLDVVEVRTDQMTVTRGLVSEAGRLDGGEVLPGFTLPVKEIFPKE